VEEIDEYIPAYTGLAHSRLQSHSAKTSCRRESSHRRQLMGPESMDNGYFIEVVDDKDWG
jgi:hypothetical protein